MPIEVKDLSNGIGNLITARGELTSDECIDLLRDHLTQDKNKFRQYRYSLSDYTQVTKFDLSPRDVQIIAELCLQAAKVNPDANVAVVASQDLIFGYSRMWQMLTEGISWDCKIFRNRENAETWLSLTTREKYQLAEVPFS